MEGLRRYKDEFWKIMGWLFTATADLPNLSTNPPPPPYRCHLGGLAAGAHGDVCSHARQLPCRVGGDSQSGLAGCALLPGSHDQQGSIMACFIQSLSDWCATVAQGKLLLQILYEMKYMRRRAGPLPPSPPSPPPSPRHAGEAVTQG